MISIFSTYSGLPLVTVLIAYFIAIIFSISLHEYSHAFVAYKCGDDTAKLMGRLTINPIKHFDIFGALCFLFIGFGWAKPVPINPMRFRSYKKGVALTSLAGVVANLFLAIISVGLYCMCLKYFNSSNNIASLFLQSLFLFFASINIALMLFNLIPIYPLDGFNFISSFLPYSSKYVIYMKQYGQILLLVLVISLSRFGFLSNAINTVFNSFLFVWSKIWGI